VQLRIGSGLKRHVLAIALTGFCAVFGMLPALAHGQDAASIHLVEQPPVKISKIAPGVYLVDFGQVAFGNLLLTPANLRNPCAGA
jgi:hypothetical protein